MRAAQSFKEILDLRGRIAVFAPSAQISLLCEQAVERLHGHVVITRGHVDKYGPMSRWRQVHACREFGLLSIDQRSSWVTGLQFPATDLVWIGEMGHPKDSPALWLRFSHAMSRAATCDEPARLWALSEGAV